jgi:tRNA-2-methylthio-N6-dimethylallyladenosine synthase
MVKKTAFIHTFGCQMNEYDSSRMMGLLETSGYEHVQSPDAADLIIVNTCSVREKAEQKVYSLLGRLKKHKKERGAKIAVSGCVAQQLGKGIFAKAPFVDIVFGTHNIDQLPEMLKDLEEGRVSIAGLEMYEIPSTFKGDPFIEEGTVKAFVTIMQGCDNFCTYCIVPLVRGGEYSRPQRGILSEVRTLTERGVREVTLLGQNVNSFGKKNGDTSFSELLKKVSRLDGVDRIRFVTSHPKDFSDDLISSFGELDKLCPHIHLPAQSGSNRVLAMMNRGYTRNHYQSIIRRLNEARPGMSYSSDFIVGFPGEKEEDFKQTLHLIEEVGYDSSYSFKFSPRPGTAAEKFGGQVEDKVKRRRLIELQALQTSISQKNNGKMVGKKVQVLVEGKSKTDDNRYTGRTECNKIVNFEARRGKKGEILTVAITGSFTHSLNGISENGGLYDERSEGSRHND